MCIIDECMNTNQVSKSRERCADISYLKPMPGDVGVGDEGPVTLTRR